MRSAAVSISCRVVKAPRLKRSELSTMSAGRRMASSTAEGSVEPLAQAEPIEQATPAMSSAMCTAWQLSPGNATFDVWGNRCRTQSVDDHAEARVTQKLLKTIAQCGHARVRVWRITLPDLQRMMQADGQFDRFSARSQAHLLKTAEDHWIDVAQDAG